MRKKNLKTNPLFTLLTIVLIVWLGILLINYFSSETPKSFEIQTNPKNEEKLLVYGLSKEDINNIDWQAGAKWANHYRGKDNYQYLLRSKGNFFLNLIKKPTVYSTTTELKAYQIRGKLIEFEKIPEIVDINIPNTEQDIERSFNAFAERSWDIERFLSIITYIISIVFSLWVSDMFFSTNFTGILFYPFKNWKKGAQESSIPHLKFKDIGGLNEAKEELAEIVTYFHNPQIFWQRGATVPKGILLVGPPGNGKTLLAKAVAGECKLPFIFRSGSDFEEMVVGLGSRRIRELFQQARSYQQGCIIFIDEIDSIGRKRYSANNHTELTLNQLLNELDGFRSRENIVILAATNTLNVLDSALLRPGRFDRQIYIPLPNQKGRREIIILQTRKLTLSKDFDLEETVALTKGLSGAQIVNMFNEASILSIRQGKRTINQEMIFEAYDRVLMGPSLISQDLAPSKKKIVAYHEAGHVVIGASLPETKVRKVTIIPRLMAGGYTWVDLRDNQGDDNLISKSQMLAHVMSFLGGRAGEELIFGTENVTVGAYDDFKKASEIVRDLIFRYGMSDLGIIPTQESFFKNEEIATELPETTKQKIEAEREKILNQCWKKVKTILRQKKNTLSLIAETLIIKNSLQKEEIDFILINQISPFISLLN